MTSETESENRNDADSSENTNLLKVIKQLESSLNYPVFSWRQLGKWGTAAGVSSKFLDRIEEITKYPSGAHPIGKMRRAVKLAGLPEKGLLSMVPVAAIVFPFTLPMKRLLKKQLRKMESRAFFNKELDDAIAKFNLNTQDLKSVASYKKALKRQVDSAPNIAPSINLRPIIGVPVHSQFSPAEDKETINDFRQRINSRHVFHLIKVREHMTKINFDIDDTLGLKKGVAYSRLGLWWRYRKEKAAAKKNPAELQKIEIAYHISKHPELKKAYEKFSPKCALNPDNDLSTSVESDRVFDRQEEQDNRCYFVVLPQGTSVSPDTVADDMPAHINAAYVQAGDQLFYVDKRRKRQHAFGEKGYSCAEELKLKSGSSLEPKALTEEDLKKIKEITGHLHGVEGTYTLEGGVLSSPQNPSNVIQQSDSSSTDDESSEKQNTLSTEIIGQPLVNSSVGYDLSLMSGNTLKENMIEFECTDKGFKYRVVGLSNGKIEEDIILWGQFPKDFPQQKDAILQDKIKYLPQILALTSKKGHTPSFTPKNSETPADENVNVEAERVASHEPEKNPKNIPAPSTNSLIEQPQQSARQVLSRLQHNKQKEAVDGDDFSDKQAEDKAPKELLVKKGMKERKEIEKDAWPSSEYLFRQFRQQQNASVVSAAEHKPDNASVPWKPAATIKVVGSKADQTPPKNINRIVIQMDANKENIPSKKAVDDQPVVQSQQLSPDSLREIGEGNYDGFTPAKPKLGFRRQLKKVDTRTSLLFPEAKTKTDQNSSVENTRAKTSADKPVQASPEPLGELSNFYKQFT